MLTSPVGWILIVSGIGTAAGGLVGLFFPRMTLQLVFAAKITDGVTMFFVRHWGALCSLRTNCVCRVRSSFPPPHLDGFRHRKDCHRCTDLLRANEADCCDDYLRNVGWNLGHPIRRISGRAVRLGKCATKATVGEVDEIRRLRCAVKGVGPQRETNPPGNWIAPPGSNRSGGGGNKAAGASGVEGRIRRLGESAGCNASER